MGIGTKGRILSEKMFRGTRYKNLMEDRAIVEQKSLSNLRNIPISSKKQVNGMSNNS